ncbi:glutamate receptor ionotropic, kainate 3 [Trichonephila clavata]|uniref:Glutamate receptor ionotropic, kainate 3 n=1 Tax=Trichonephila clavata TaxID=2740835 RepID=A0A8X6G7B4_TRICU|nr:glutamate receptor ionotropic, kainate 3 [Trichonephila clavata]
MTSPPRFENAYKTMHTVLNSLRSLDECETEEVSRDVHTVNLEDFQYIGTNITGFRIVNQSPEYQEIVQDWKSSYATGKSLDSEQAPYAKTDVALMYDAVWTFATALNTLEKGQRLQIKPISCATEKQWSFGPTLANHMRGVELRGLTGRIVFDEQGMRTNFTVKVQDLTHIGLTEVGEWEHRSNRGIRKTGNYSRQPEVSFGLRNKTLVITTILVKLSLSSEKTNVSIQFSANEFKEQKEKKEKCCRHIL